jgi:hypothetical protein
MRQLGPQQFHALFTGHCGNFLINKKISLNPERTPTLISQLRKRLSLTNHLQSRHGDLLSRIPYRSHPTFTPLAIGGILGFFSPGLCISEHKPHCQLEASTGTSFTRQAIQKSDHRNHVSAPR